MQNALVKGVGNKGRLPFEELYGRLTELSFVDENMACLTSIFAGSLRTLKLLRDINQMVDHLKDQKSGILSPILHAIERIENAVIGERDYHTFIQSRIQVGSVFVRA